MSDILAKRVAAEMPGEFVVFLIGMRINKIWKIWRWWPVISEMPKMLSELYRDPELGFIKHHTWFGRTVIVLQYWKGFDELDAYAKNRDKAHLPAWRSFNQKIGSNGDVGIWHETYVVGPGRYEGIYNNMPVFGLAGAGRAVDAVGHRLSARGRIERRRADLDDTPRG